MPGLFETGGALDSLFDVFRGELGKADTEIQAWFHDRLKQDTDRYNIQRVLYVYAQGIKSGQYTQFKGSSDPQVPTIIAFIKSNVAFDEQFIYNVLYALFDAAKTDMSCASVLAGSDGNLFDGLMNGGITNTVTGVVNDTFKGLGLPSLANSLIIVVVLALVGALIWYKFIRK